MLEGKKINELQSISTISDETVVPAVYVNNGSANSEASKVSIDQIKAHINEDNYTKNQVDTLLNTKQNKLTAGNNITIEESDENLVISATDTTYTAGEGITIDNNVISAQGGSSYTAGTGIEIESDEISVDNTVWTKNNLKSGKNVLIEKHINPYVINEDTLAVFHFDGNFNFINGADKQEHPVSDIGSLTEATTTTSRYKFGTASSTGTGWYPGYISSSKKDSNPLNNNSYVLNLEKSFTLDFWWYGESSSSSSAGLGKDRQALYINKSSAYDNYIQLDVLDYNRNTKRMQTSASVITVDAWNHIAITYDASGSTGVAKLYVNGTKVGSDLTGIVKTSSSTDFFDAIKVSGSMNGNIDEIRISKGIIWDGNFTPPTEAYAESVEEYYEINASDLVTTSQLSTQLASKQDTLTAGSNITISDNVISATDTTYTAGTNITIENNVISATGASGADTSLSNLTDTGKIQSAHLAMPSSVYDELTSTPADGAEYTAPADGYFLISIRLGQETGVKLKNGHFIVACPSPFSTYLANAYLPVKKGDKCVVTYGTLDSDQTSNYFRFYYAVGSESEASQS